MWMVPFSVLDSAQDPDVEPEAGGEAVYAFLSLHGVIQPCAHDILLGVNIFSLFIFGELNL